MNGGYVLSGQRRLAFGMILASMFVSHDPAYLVCSFSFSPIAFVILIRMVNDFQRATDQNLTAATSHIRPLSVAASHH